MTELPDEIFRTWIHSSEEDKDETIVYRPIDYDFPPARKREGIEFRSDGVFIALETGPADAMRGINGHWELEDSKHVRVSFEEGTRSSTLLEILQCDSEILKVRRLPASS